MLIRQDTTAAVASEASIHLSKEWHLLGPFRVGTREAVWGANPLEALGGFHNLPVDDGATFHSPLSTNGVVKWSILDDTLVDDAAGDGGGLSLRLNVTFPEVDWAAQQSVYGWAALQYQAFARGFITVDGQLPYRAVIYTDSILEFAINDKQFFGGDMYGFRRAPVVLNLNPGQNKIVLRLIRDVRAMGGIAVPSISVRISIQRGVEVLNVDTKSIVLPDIVEGKMASVYGSVIVRNNSQDWISIIGVQNGHKSLIIQLLTPSGIRIAPGQSRCIGLHFLPGYVGGMKATSIALIFVSKQHFKQASTSFELRFREATVSDPHKFTFLHPSGVVSYAILRPPTKSAIKSKLPVLLNLHGAGLQADSHQVRHMLDVVPDLDAWVLFPAGMSPWSSDDWHVWGLADVKAAVLAIPYWTTSMGWTGPGVDTEKWVVTGHSNGGQGAWYIATHYPDKVVAVAAASGYSSIQNYVPYSMWREASPLADAAVQSSLCSYRHELLLENLRGLPICLQHGARDGNVPPYHSRLLCSLLREAEISFDYAELPEQGHWFEGAMTTHHLRAFYSAVLDAETSKREIPQVFHFVVPNTGDIGSRAGIFVDQLQSPDFLARVSVHRDDAEHSWLITTSNIRRMHFDFCAAGVAQPSIIVIDKTQLQPPFESGPGGETAIVRSGDRWQLCDNHDWKVLGVRFGRQRGSMDAFLMAESVFKILVCSSRCFEAALQVSRNLMQYYGADADIVDTAGHDWIPHRGNVIVLGIGNDIPPSHFSGFPLQVSEAGVQIRRPPFHVIKQIPSQPGLGGALVRPLPNEDLELVIWGCDAAGLQQALRMVPTLTGVGQPDFVILSEEARWRGHAGAVAMGFFDHSWQISQASYVSGGHPYSSC